VDALLDTVKGEVSVTKGAKVAMPGMRTNVDAWVLKDTPLCASMGLLIEKHGFRIDWRAGCCRWIDPEGNTTVLQDEDNTPILEGGLYPVFEAKGTPGLLRALQEVGEMKSDEASAAMLDFEKL